MYIYLSIHGRANLDYLVDAACAQLRAGVAGAGSVARRVGSPPSSLPPSPRVHLVVDAVFSVVGSSTYSGALIGSGTGTGAGAGPGAGPSLLAPPIPTIAADTAAAAEIPVALMRDLVADTLDSIGR